MTVGVEGGRSHFGRRVGGGTSGSGRGAGGSRIGIKQRSEIHEEGEIHGITLGLRALARAG
jgi:hypothetical protein